MSEIDQLLVREVYPRLGAEQIYSDSSHRFVTSGDRMRGGCPWHESRSGSSFVVSHTHPERLWFCAGCQKGGSPIGYVHSLRTGRVENPRGADFIEAARTLFDMAGVPFPEQQLTGKQAERLELLEVRRQVIEATADYCQQVLQSDTGAQALAYTMERTGLTLEEIQDLELGFYPSAVLLRRYLLERFRPEEIGFSRVVTDRLEGYVTIPWRDEHGRMLTLYGRWAGPEPPEGSPKTYALPNPQHQGQSVLHSKRSPLFFDRVRKHGHRHITAVEGLFDAIVLQAKGFTETCAYVAAGLSNAQVKTLKHCGIESATIVPDPDTGGNNGAASCTERLLTAGIAAYVSGGLPEGMDPDEFILRYGPDAWRAHLKRAEPAGRFIARTEIEKLEGRGQDPVDLSTARGREEALIAAASRIKHLPPLHRAEGAEAIAGKLSLKPEVVTATISALDTGGTIHDPGHDGRESPLENRLNQPKNALHDSRLLRDRERDERGPEDGQNRACPVIPLWGFKQPAPLSWIVPGFIPKGFVTLLAADGGSGKSYLAIFLSLCIALGLAFFGLGVRRGRVLYVDYELDEDEQKRRVWRVLAGMGMTPEDPRLAGHFYYYRPRHPLSSGDGHDEVVNIIREHEIDLVILDSLTIGMGADATSQEDVTHVMQRFREWGTVFAIDHISGQSARGNQSQARPFGSVFKRNVARSTFTLARAEAGGHLLTSDKANFGPQQDLLCYAVDFLDQGERVVFRRLDHADEEMTGAMRHMRTHDVTLLAIKSIYRSSGAGVSADDVVTWRSEHDDADTVKRGTVANHFTVLSRDGKIELIGDGTVIPVEAAHTVHDAIHDDPRSTSENRPKQHQKGHSRFTIPIGVVNRESGGDGTDVTVEFEFTDDHGEVPF